MLTITTFILSFLFSFINGHEISLLSKAKKENTPGLVYEQADGSVSIDLAPEINGVSLNHFSSFSLDYSPLSIETEDTPRIIVLHVAGDKPTTIRDIDSLSITALNGLEHKIYIINPHGISCNNCTFSSNIGLSSHMLDEEELKTGKIKWKAGHGFIQIDGSFTAHDLATLETNNLGISSSAYLSGAKSITMHAQNITHAGTTAAPHIIIKADHVMVTSDNPHQGIFAHPTGENHASTDDCLDAILEMKVRVRIDNFAVIHSAGNLLIDTLSLKNTGGVLHGCNLTKISTQWLYNQDGQVLSNHALHIEGQNKTQTPYVRNERGQFISGGAMLLDAKKVENIASTPTFWKKPVIAQIPVKLLMEDGSTQSTTMTAKINYLYLKEPILESIIKSHDAMTFTGDLISNYYAQIWARRFPPRPSDQRSIVDLTENFAYAFTSTVELIPSDLNRRVSYTWFLWLEWDHRKYCVSNTLMRLGVKQVKRIEIDKTHPDFQAAPYIPDFCDIVGDLKNDQSCSIKCKPFPYATITSSISADEKIEGKVSQINQRMLYSDENGEFKETIFQTRFFAKDDIKSSDQIIPLAGYFEALKKKQQLYISSSVPDKNGVRYDLVPAWHSNYDLPFDSSVALKLLAQAAGRIANIYLPAHPAIEQIVVETALARPLGYKRYGYLDILQNGLTYAIQNKWPLGVAPTAEQLSAMPDNTVVLSYIFTKGQDDQNGYMPVIYVDAATAAKMKSQVGPAVAAAALDLEIEANIENKGRLVAFGGDAYFYSKGQLHIQCGSIEVSNDLLLVAKNGAGMLKGCRQKHLLGNGITHDEDVPMQLAVAKTIQIQTSENFEFNNVHLGAGDLNIKTGNATNPGNFTISPGMDHYEDSRSNQQNHDYFGWGSNSTQTDKSAHYDKVKPSYVFVDGTISGNVTGSTLNKASVLHGKKISLFSSQGFYNIPIAQEKLTKESVLNTIFGLGFTFSWEELSVSLGGSVTKAAKEKASKEFIKASVIAEEGGEIVSDGVIENQAGFFSGLNLIAPKVRFICAQDSRNQTSSSSNVHAGISAGVQQNLSKGFKRIAKISEQNNTRAEDYINASAEAIQGGAEIVAAIENPGRAGVWAGIGGSYAQEILHEALANCAGFEAKNNTIQTDELETEGTQITGSGLKILAKRWKNLIEIKNEFHALRTQIGGEATLQLWGVGNPVSIGVSAMFHNTDQVITPYTTLEIDGKLEIQIDEQADLTGVQIKAKDIEATFGDLLLASLQNTLTERSAHGELSVSASPATIAKAAAFAMGGGGAGVSARDRQWVDQLAFIIGTERAHITVKNMLKMTGSLIANADRDVDGKFTDKGKLQLAATKLIAQDLEDLDEGLTLGAGYQPGSTESVSGAYTAEFGVIHRKRTVHSTVGMGEANITEGAENIKRNVSEIFETKADFEIKPIHIYVPVLNFNAISDWASYRLQQISRIAGDAAHIFRQIELSLEERANIRKSAAQAREEEKAANDEKVKAQKSGDKIKAEAAAYQEMLAEQEANLQEQVEKCATILEKINTPEDRLVVAQLKAITQKRLNRVLSRKEKAQNLDKQEIKESLQGELQAMQNDWKILKEHIPNEQLKLAIDRTLSLDLYFAGKWTAKSAITVGSRLDETDQYIQTMWRSDYGDRTQVLQASILPLGPILRYAATSAALLYKTYAPWVKKEIPRLATKLAKKMQEEDGWLSNSWDKVAGWFGGENSKPKIFFPEKDGQIKYIFRKDEGHVEDTPENRKMILDTATDQNNHIATDKFGLDWFTKVLPNGKQVWVRVRGNQIDNAGVNNQVEDLLSKRIQF